MKRSSGYESELELHIQKERAAVKLSSKVGELLYNNGIENPILRAGDERGVPTRRSVRVASETTSILQLDGTASKARHRLQIALLIIVLLVTNWSRLRSEEVE